MADQTPDGAFQYPEAGDLLWYQNGYQTLHPDTGAAITQDYDGVVDWLEQLELLTPADAATIADLPSPPGRSDDRTGKRRHAIAHEDRQLLYDDPNGGGWQTIAGHGTDTAPIPQIVANQITIPEKPSNDNDAIRQTDLDSFSTNVPFDPMTETLNANGHDIQGAGTVDTQSITLAGTDLNSRVDLEGQTRLLQRDTMPPMSELQDGDVVVID